MRRFVWESANTSPDELSPGLGPSARALTCGGGILVDSLCVLKCFGGACPSKR